MAFHPTSLVRLYTFICFICALLACLGAAPAHAATQTGTLNAGQYAYHDITLPTPQSGMRLVLSTGSASNIGLYAGSNHQTGNFVTGSYGKTVHTLLLAPNQLANGASYHVRIYAQSSTSYSFTDDLKFISGDLTWDDGSSFVGTSAISQPDTAGGDYLFRITGHAPSHSAWRNALKVTSGEADLYLRQGSAPVTGGTYSSADIGSDAIYLDAGASLSGQVWYLRVNATPGATWQLASGDLCVQDLTWDSGSAPGGTNLTSQPSSEKGDYFFRITSKVAAYGAWRSVLKVSGGEADLYLRQGSVPVGDTTFKSVNAGSEGIILDSTQFGDNQIWYLRVRSSAASTWNIFSGDIYAHDLGTVSASGASATVQVGPEGTYYFKSSAAADTEAWRLWLNGSSNQIYVSKGKAPVKNAWLESAEQSETGQALLVPPYLGSALYLVGVKGSPGSSFTLESRKQPILTPNQVSGYLQGEGELNFDFTLPSQGNAGGFGYLTYRIDVPIQQIAWQVLVTPGSAGQNPEVYLRRGGVPNRWMNDALSEAPSGVIDSITQVPPTLTDGAWYVTVYGSGSYTFSLTSKNPVVTGATFINNSDPNPVPPGYGYPYQTVPLANGAQFLNQSGWRYYQVSDISSQLGLLGWQLDLANQVPSSEIALRRNAVPARWSYRNGGSSYSTGKLEASHLDLSSTTGLLQHPGHPADIWYVGVYTPNQALGEFQLATRETPAPQANFSEGSVSVSGQSPISWQWFKYTIPSDAALKGWDLRLKATAGSPQMVVRRDQLPETFAMSYSSSCGNAVNQCNSWESGFQWPATPGSDWTNRNYVTSAPSYTPDKNGYLIMGMNHPLEPGTYYVGVSRDSGSDATPMSYTLESRAIGLAASSYPIKVQDLAYTGGVASGSNLAPREVAWYRVLVPEGAGSWSLSMTPSQGEALVAVRRGTLPNTAAWNPGVSADGNYGGAVRQKEGTEYFYKYAADYESAIPAGEYYLAVVSEGQNPASNSTIGTGNVSYTLTSVGAMPVDDKSSTPLAVGSALSWNGQSLPYHAQKAYRVRVPAGLTSIEVRFKNKVGNPLIAIRQDVAGAGKFPILSPYHSEGASEGGASAPWQSYTYPKGFSNVVTIASPVAGDYTLVVRADRSGDNIATDAAYDLEVEAMGTVTLAFASGSQAVSGQDPQTWRYFKVVVPSDAALKGWDLRLKATAGSPQMVVRRDQLPETFSMSYSPSCGNAVNQCNSWESGFQWPATPGSDWTIRNYVTWDPGYTPDKNGYLIMGMNHPLEPGTYYVGVSRGSGSDATPMSYALESRAIGLAGSSYPIKVQDLAYTGGVASGSNLAPREAAWYRVLVPEGAGSWSVSMTPSQGEALVAVRRGTLPNTAAWNPGVSADGNYGGAVRQKEGTEYFYKYAADYESAIPAGEYYLAVVSEGQNPASNSTIGTGNVGYTLTSVGAMPVDDKSSTPLAVGSMVSWNGQSLPYHAQKAYRVRVPAGLTSIEVRFKNKVGNPLIAIRQDEAGAAKFPILSPYHSEGASEGGANAPWQSYIYPKGFSDVVTIASPVAGDYTLVVRADLSGDNVPTDAAYDLEVEALTPTPMLISTSAPLTGRLIDQQVSYYQVEVPAQVDGFDLAGWKINVATTTGAVSLRVAKGMVPGGTTPSLASSAPVTVVAPPYLSPGTWFIEVKGTGITDYAITSDIISAGPEKHRRSWTMPDRDNLNASGTTFSYPAGLSAPEIGDSGLDAQGNPIINPNTGDQGTDLAQDDWHFYRIVVPENNGGHLKTVLEALSGTPELYLRAGGVPSPFHRADASNPNNYNAPPSHDRSQSVSGTMYGNWVPLDRRTALQLTPGDWWLGVKALGSNIRYRLKVAAGNVRDANAPVDSADPQPRLFQDLVQDGGSYTGQSLAAGNMRYYRVSIPQSATTSSTALAWTLTLQQQVGAVVLFLRDTVPPGQGANGDALRNASYYVTARSDQFQDWYDDNSSLEPNPYLVLDTPGAHTISLPPLRPGATYYLGVIAKTDATFDLSSAIGADRLKLDDIIPFADGSVSTTIAGGERRLYRVDVPADALVWRHDALHDAGIRLYLTQGTLPSKGYSDHWYSNGQANSSLTRNLTGYPMQPGYPYYLLVENTTGSPLPFSLDLSGRDALSRLSVTVAGDCPGSKVTSSDLINCTSGTCTADLVPYSSIYLAAQPGPGCGVTVTGACTSSGCVLDMAAATNVTATFKDVSAPYIDTFSIPATSAVATVPVTFSATDNLAVTGFCVSESSDPAGCNWQATPPSSYTFSGIPANTPTGRYLYGHVKDAAGNINYRYAYLVLTITKARLTTQLAGTGSGSVNSNPAGIACTAGSCSSDFGLGSAVTLLQSPSGGSQFAGWSGACTGTGACSVTVDAAKSVTATFNALPPVRIVGITTVYYSTLQAAYDAAKSGAVIQLRQGALTGSLYANRAIKVTLKGGFNAGYSSNSGGVTTIGRSTIKTGLVLFERVKVK